MVKRARRFARVLLALTIPVTTFAQNPSDIGGGPPPNLNSGAFQSTVELMWRASPTFRGQCARLAPKPRLRVVVRSDSSRPVPVVRAHTEITRIHGTVTHANVVISDGRDAVELIAHEMEHIMEQIDGLRLEEAVCVGNRPVRAGESCRAIEIGRRVAKEVEESRHRPNQH
jgi:hypothetical protein